MTDGALSAGAKLGISAVAALMMTVVGIVGPLTKNEAGEYSYVVSVAVLLSEVVKLLISLTFVAMAHRRQNSSMLASLRQRAADSGCQREFLLYILPSATYFVLNNLQLIILKAISPVAFSLISQLKTILTGLLFVAIIGRKLSATQWLALAVLSCATATAIDTSTAHEDSGGGVMHAKYSLPATLGVMLTVLASFLSALAGVFNELLLKSRPTSVHAQNLQMYLWGVVFAILYLCVQSDARQRVWENGLLGGFNATTWLWVLAQASNGLAISFVLKWVNNLARVFASSASLITIMLLSCWLFGSRLTVQLVIATLLVGLSMLQYSITPEQLEQTAAELCAPLANSPLGSCCNRDWAARLVGAGGGDGSGAAGANGMSPAGVGGKGGASGTQLVSDETTRLVYGTSADGRSSTV